jgi:hypothetical protein
LNGVNDLLLLGGDDDDDADDADDAEMGGGGITRIGVLSKLYEWPLGWRWWVASSTGPPR